MILLHVLIAVCSLIYTGYTYFHPSTAKLRLSYALVAFTSITGTYLIIIMPAHMVRTCFEGITYIVIVSVTLFYARHKLAKQGN